MERINAKLVIRNQRTQLCEVVQESIWFDTMDELNQYMYGYLTAYKKFKKTAMLYAYEATSGKYLNTIE